MTTPRLTIVVAVTRDMAIGRDGDMLYHIPTDLRHFKEVTMGHAVIMGRRTFESLPKGALPGRRNIVVTRNSAFSAPGVETAPSLEAAVEMSAPDSNPMIIGGGQIYARALGMATHIELTLIDATAPGADTYFPKIDCDKWQEISHTGPVIDPRSGLSLEFVCLCRK